MDKSRIRVIAMDLDGTLTQHKQPLSPQTRSTLEALGRRYRLLMVGAGQAQRIFRQMERFPIDIIGNYGMQYAAYDAQTDSLRMLRDEAVTTADRGTIEAKVTALREKHGYTGFAGDSVEYHPSGCLTFPLLGTKARQEDKLAFDPDRTIRRSLYAEVCEAFPDYCVFVGGSSSFDMAPRPYNKRYALELYCREHGLAHGEVLFIGDDYGTGGNDESVYLSDFPFLCVDDYRTFPALVQPLLDTQDGMIGD